MHNQNLGIVFGPTLMRPKELDMSMSTTPSLVVEFLLDEYDHLLPLHTTLVAEKQAAEKAAAPPAVHPPAAHPPAGGSTSLSNSGHATPAAGGIGGGASVSGVSNTSLYGSAPVTTTAHHNHEGAPTPVPRVLLNLKAPQTLLRFLQILLNSHKGLLVLKFTALQLFPLIHLHNSIFLLPLHLQDAPQFWKTLFLYSLLVTLHLFLPKIIIITIIVVIVIVIVIMS